MPGSNNNSTYEDVFGTQPEQAAETTYTNPYAPKTAFYSPKSFDYDELLRLKYGTDASRRDQRKFKRYWKSDQRHEDLLAFDKAETDKMFTSADARFKEINDAYKARNSVSQAAAAVTSQKTIAPATVSTSVTTPPPALRPRKTNTEWDAIAASKLGEGKTMQDVISLQLQLGITADGKWGKNTQAAYDAYLASQNSSIPTSLTDNNPVNTTPVTSPEHVVKHIPGRGDVSLSVEEPITNLGKAQPQHWGHRWAKPFEGATGLGKDLANLFIWMGDNGMFQKQSGYQQPRPLLHKQGGIMNRINYFQKGGAAPQQQDIQQQVVALVQAAMQGDQKAKQTVNQIMEAAKAGDQQAIQIAQLMEQVVKELQGQATSAKWGSKLGYIKSLKYAKGGKTCPACEKKVEMKACGGKKAKKRYFGGLV